MPAVAPPDRRAHRKEARRQAIIDIAERSFLDRGYDATSMSQIAADCGGSKTTLWTHFPSKEELFAAFLDRRVGHFAEALDQALIPAGGTAAALDRFGRVFLAKIMTPESCALRRLIVSEGPRFPALAQAFYERGPERCRTRLRRYMGEEIAAGRLRDGDPELAARQFLALCQAGLFADIVWQRPTSSAATPAEDVAHAVEAFLRSWSRD